MARRLGACWRAPASLLRRGASSPPPARLSRLGPRGPSDPISRAAAPFGYDLVGWEWRHLANRWLYKIGHLFGDGASVEEENDMVRRYFALAGDVESLERPALDRGLPDEGTLDG